MATFVFNGKEVEFEEGENIIEATKRIGHEIPHYCYHKGMDVVAQCRMCMIEVEGARKLMTACSTPVKEGMVVSSNSPAVKKAIAGVQEFLLINHPLDCPICDEAGECSLQEYSLLHGAGDTRNEFPRRTFLDVDMGPSIKKNMNRCIHCTRCIRYSDQICGEAEMVAIHRGNSTEITTVHGEMLQTPYSGGFADVCPVGSLTTKDFRFSKRSWYLKTSKSICDGCSKGCNIELYHENGIIFRLQPQEEAEINGWWMCDEGRYGFHHIHSPSRVLTPKVNKKGSLRDSDWSNALDAVSEILKSSKQVAVLACGDTTCEEAAQLKSHFGRSAKYFTYSPTVKNPAEDKDLDHLLRRKDKSPNLAGLMQEGYEAFDGLNGKSFEAIIVVSAGKVRPPYSLMDLDIPLVGMGLFLKEDIGAYAAILPGLSSYEKSGTFVHSKGETQKFKAGIPPLGRSWSLEDTLTGLIDHGSKKVG